VSSPAIAGFSLYLATATNLHVTPKGKFRDPDVFVVTVSWRAFGLCCAKMRWVFNGDVSDGPERNLSHRRSSGQTRKPWVRKTCGAALGIQLPERT